METLWFCLVAAMIAAYVVLDGFDLGAGIVHLLVARTDGERRLVLRSIGPFWDGNEVWLLAAAGTLYFAFPVLYASSFSGFYLPLMFVLWLLILRGIAIEFRSHIDSPAWKPFWDAVFSSSSALLAVFYGVALGNVVRGVPLDSSGYFFEPLWTNFRPGRETGILDWYTVPVGLLSFAALLAHGALWVALRTEAGGLRGRAVRAARPAWWAVVALTALVTFLTFRVQPNVPARLNAHPWGYIFPLLALAGLLAMRSVRGRRADRRAFLGSCAYLSGMLASAAFGIYPCLLPANADPAFSLTVHNAAAAEHGLRIGLAWWIPGMALAAAYFTFAHRTFAGKASLEGEGY
jgi:cytochrome d ubiquinol oxidase subunit II